MRANNLFLIEISIGGDNIIAHGRVLYWWEEQEIKSNAIYEDKDNKMIKEDLLTKSIESGIEVQWSDVLHFSSIIPLYNAYLEVSESSSVKIKAFRRKVLAVYDPSLRTDSIDDYPLPPEVIEFNLMKHNGTLNREDLYRMSYSEILRHQIIKEIDSKYVAQKVQEQQGHSGIPPGTYGLDPNFTNVQDVARKHFPEVVV